MPRCLREHDQQPADGRVGDVLDHPFPFGDRHDPGQQQERGRRIDAHHRRLLEVDVRGQWNGVVASHAAALRPVLALQIDDQIAGFHVADAVADGGHAADAFRARRRRQRRPQPITAAAEGHVGRVDRKGEHVEDHFIRAGSADILDLGAACDFPGRTVAVYQHLLHARTHPLCWPDDCLYGDLRGSETPDGATGIRRDEIRCGRRGTGPLSRGGALARTDIARATRGDPARRRCLLPPPGHHLRRLWCGRRSRDDDPLRHHSARHGLGRVGLPAQGPGTAGDGAERLSGRRLRHARDLPRRYRAGGTGPAQCRVRGDGAGTGSAARRARPYRRHRPGAGRRKGLLRPRGQCAHAVGRVLRAGEPRSDDAAGARAFLGDERAAGRQLHGGAARHPALGRRSATTPSPMSCC